MGTLADMTAAVAAALAPTGVRVTADPSAVVPPCVLVDANPTLTRPGACGWVREWRLAIIPAATTDALAARWHDEHLEPILDALWAVGQITEPVEPVTFTLAGDTEVGITAYQTTLTT